MCNGVFECFSCVNALLSSKYIIVLTHHVVVGASIVSSLRFKSVNQPHVSLECKVICEKS